MELPVQFRITSDQNPNYKRWRHFVQQPSQANCPWVPVEGVKQISDLSQGRSIELLLVAEASLREYQQIIKSAETLAVLPDRLFAKLSRVKSPQGAIAFLAKPKWSWQDLTPYLIYLHEVQDPGNLGTILRTAAATGLFSMLSSPGTVSFFNDKVVRASAGCLFSVPFMENVDLAEVESRGFDSWIASPYEGPTYFQMDFKKPVAFVLSNEGHGLSQPDVERRLKPVRIPMKSGIDSLNVAVSGSLLMYEIVRRTQTDG